LKPLDRIVETCRSAPRRIVLAEGEDPRVIEAVLRAEREGLTEELTLIGNAARIRDQIAARGGRLDRFRIEDPATSPLKEAFVEGYVQLRRHKGVDHEAARSALADPIGFAAMMVREGCADGMIGGAVATTTHTVRTALQIIGRAPRSRLVSSFFLMMLCGPEHVRKGAFVFADCGLVIEPDVEELADIAIASADSYAALTGGRPSVAMLSFSTMGSALHARVDKVVEATQRVRVARPDLLIDGELQFDAAFVPAVNSTKASGSVTGGEANVFVFPNLEAGNIGYKIAQRIGGAVAIGPVLQGLARPANDLSRGCSADDVYSMIAVTGVQAARSAARLEAAAV
jgi:phosphate acetyltransferase